MLNFTKNQFLGAKRSLRKTSSHPSLCYNISLTATLCFFEIVFVICNLHSCLFILAFVPYLHRYVCTYSLDSILLMNGTLLENFEEHQIFRQFCRLAGKSLHWLCSVSQSGACTGGGVIPTLKIFGHSRKMKKCVIIYSINIPKISYAICRNLSPAFPLKYIHMQHSC